MHEQCSTDLYNNHYPYIRG